VEGSLTAAKEADLASNLLLGKLVPADRARLAPHMLVFELKAGDTIHRAGDDVVDTWFPCEAAMAAFCVETSDGAGAVEVAVIGREGALGGIVSNGRLPAYATSQVRFGGRFLRIKTAALEQAKLESITLRHWFSRYSDCLLAQVFQTAACNATHTISQRTAKWLLAAASRTARSDFDLTHEQLALLLGVGRTFVTRTLRTFRDAGMIATTRGRVAILDEPALRRTSCACTAAIEEHFDTVLHGIYPAV
jgi:CRP-like cAMP-binding protein